MNVGVISYLVEGRLPPEATHPSEAITELYVISAQNKRGNNYELNGFQSFDKTKADALLEKIQTHLDAGGSLNFDHWNEKEPVYGSDAYCEQYGF